MGSDMKRGFKRTQIYRRNNKKRNNNKPDNHLDKLKYYSNGCLSFSGYKFNEFVAREYGIKFSSNRDDFDHSNIDVSDMNDEEIYNLNEYLWNSYYKRVPHEWELFHDQTRWRVDKNKSKAMKRARIDKGFTVEL